MQYGATNGYVPDLDGRPVLLPARFEWKEKKVSDNPPQFTKVPYITIFHHGGDTSVRPVSEKDKFDYPKQWAAFERDQNQDEIGWTLDNCTFLDVAEIATYKARNIRTVEQLAAATDTAVTGIMGARDHRKKAAAMLKQANDQKPLMELCEKNTQLENQIGLLQTQLNEVLSELDKVKEKKSK